jgi:Icc-related predicted phosphoesterase
MKITCISDTHTYHREIKLEPTDILIFGGDFMNSGHDEEEVIDFLSWFYAQPAKYKIMIAGNHDRYVENYGDAFKSMLDVCPEIIYLQDEIVTIEGFKIYGTPHSKIFYNWAFNRSEEALSRLFDKIPLDTNILISHAPQLGVLDELVSGENVGEKTLSNRINELQDLKLHVFGHIHNGFGMIKPHNKSYISVNAAQVDERYELNNFPIIINL